MTIIAQGAEAVIHKERGNILKVRVPKGYRHPSLDEKLRKHRTRVEAKILAKLQEMQFPSPRILKKDEHTMTLEMENIEGKKLSEVLDKKNGKRLGKEIGGLVAVLHLHHIIHGDLTTSNMILKEKVFLIDYGLSFISKRVEDKAVDLHLLRQALESRHYACWMACFAEVCNAYKKAYAEAPEVLRRLEIVEQRGRNKPKF